MQGLQNLGSTCAINSLIQIICRTRHLRDTVLKQDISLTDTLTYQLKEILDMMHNHNHSLSPKKFVNHLYKSFEGIFQPGEQLDIGELWMFLFDKISNECGANITEQMQTIILDLPLPDNSNSNLAKSEELFQKCQSTIQKINNNKSSIWLETSQGIMLNMLKCHECDEILYNFEPFTSIALDITNEELPSVSSMFRNYLRPIDCNADWKCEKCNKYTHYTKCLKLWKMPPVLTFIIKRFTDMHQKNCKPIKINTKLCVKKGSIISNMEEDYNYNCTSMALHYGNLSGGHYCALCQTGENFVLYDDLNMSIIQHENMKKVFDNNIEAYMLVYTL